jgi:hypothetical protein
VQCTHIDPIHVYYLASVTAARVFRSSGRYVVYAHWIVWLVGHRRIVVVDVMQSYFSCQGCFHLGESSGRPNCTRYFGRISLNNSRAGRILWSKWIVLVFVAYPSWGHG